MFANGYIAFVSLGTTDKTAKFNIVGLTKAERGRDSNTVILRAFNKEITVLAEKTNALLQSKLKDEKAVLYHKSKLLNLPHSIRRRICK